MAVATILFLVDGKLVLLQPTTSEGGELKYEMRIIAQNVETYALMRDHPAFALNMQADSLPPSPSVRLTLNEMHGHDLRDSLWFFDGQDMRVWIDMQDVLASASADLGRDLPTPVKVPVDFYPLSALINKAIIFGVELELIQRRDASFAFLRFGTRVGHRAVFGMSFSDTFQLLTTPADPSFPSCRSTLSFGAIQSSRRFTLEPSLSAPLVFSSCSRNLTA